MIDPRQRYDDEEAMLRLALGQLQSTMFTALPGVIQSFNAAKLTAVVQPAIQGIITKQDGTTQTYNYPQLLDVPVVFPRGGNCTLTFPVASGDECLVVFSSRCIDAWWNAGGTSNVPLSPRMHSLSDGFCIPGPFSQATKISNVSTSYVQLRSNDGSTYVQLDPSGQIATITAPGGVKINGNVSVSGFITASGDITADENSTKISLTNHVHTGVQSGGSNTGPAQG